MKIEKLLWMLMLPVMFLASCGDDDGDDNGGSPVEVTGISFDNEELALTIDSVGTITATLEPSGAEATIVWVSSDDAVATVDEGDANNIAQITAVAEGTCQIAASVGAISAIADVTVSAKDDGGDASLQGTDYHVVLLDDVSFETISAEVTNDFRVDETNTFLYIWDGTFNAGTSSGLNFYGEDAGWTSLVVGSVGWSGAGFNVSAGYGDIDMTSLADSPEDYYLHLGFKSAQPNSTYLLILTDGQAEAKIAIGGDFNDNGAVFEEYANFERDGEWQEIEIPVTDLNDLGLFFNETFSDVNIFAFLAGGTQGDTMDMDAIFFYKKGE